MWTAEQGVPSIAPTDALVQLDGRIVVVGTTPSAGGAIAMVRLLPDGSLDATFGTGGVASPAGLGEPAAAALGPDDEIIVAGRRLGVAAVARYDRDALSAPAFLALPGADLDYPDDVVVTGDAIAIAATRQIADADWRLAVHRLDLTGAYDATIVDDVGDGRWIRPRALVADDEGRLTAAAETVAGGDVVLARYRIDLSRDESFGVDGVVHVAPGQPNAGVAGLLVERSGRIIVGLHGYDGDGPRFGAVALQPSGELDGNYGVGGRAWTIVLGNTLVARSIRPTPDRGVVIAGTRSDLPAFFAVRLTPDGRADECFASNGYLLGPIGESTAAVIAPDGGLVLIGSKWWGPIATRLVAARYTR